MDYPLGEIMNITVDQIREVLIPILMDYPLGGPLASPSEITVPQS